MSNRRHQGEQRAQLLHLEAQMAALSTLEHDLRVALANEPSPYHSGPLVMRLQLAAQDRARLERRRKRIARKQIAVPGALTASDALAEAMEVQHITPLALEHATRLTMSEILDLLAGRKMTERQAGALAAAKVGTVNQWRIVSNGFAPD